MPKRVLHSKRLFPLSLFGIAVVTLFLQSGKMDDKTVPHRQGRTNLKAAPTKKSKVDTISISVVGDMMVGSNYPAPSYLPPPEEGNILLGAMRYLKTTDIRIGNLEGAISEDAPLHKECSGQGCYAFRTPYKYAQWYKTAGFDYLNLANNHSFDFGVPGVEHTLSFLDQNNIRCSGIPQHPFDTLTVRNTRIGFVSFAPHNNCLDLNNDSVVKAYIGQVRPLCDLLVIFFHGGGEGATMACTPIGHEFFLEQDRGDVRSFAHLCIDEGADLVFGSGPHVVRGMEIYKDKLIAYSLGNFATYHLFNLRFPNNVAPLQQVRITSDGKLIDNRVVSFLQHGEGIPSIDSNKNAFQLIRSLSKDDFGFSGVRPGGR